MSRWQALGLRKKKVASPVKVADERVDPYARWAVLTDWRAQQRMAGRALAEGVTPSLRLLARTKDPMSFRSFQELLGKLVELGWEVPPVYRRPLGSADKRLRHFTASICPDRMRDLLASPPQDVLWELAAPLRDAETVARAHPSGLFGERDAQAFRPAKRPYAMEVHAAATSAGPFLDGFLAAVDFGCPLLHRQFRDEGEETTRLAAFWDQGAEPKRMNAWRQPRQLAYGREIHQPTLNALLVKLRAGNDDEASVYRQLDHLIAYDDPRRRIWAATHGAHVLDLLGGRIDPVSGRDDDWAARSPLAFVQVPSLTAGDCSGASAGAQILDALRYLLSLWNGSKPVVVNLSVGTHAGPHDGRSLIEGALTEIIDAQVDRPFAIVVAAGNARELDGHVRRIVRPDESALLRLNLVPDDTTDTFVETWFDASGGPQVKMRVRSAEGDWSPWVGLGDDPELPREVVLRDDASLRPIVSLRIDPPVANGHRGLALLALSPTARPSDDDGPLASPGSWEIEVASSRGQVVIDAWIERDDPGPLGGERQSYFVGVDASDRLECLNHIATAKGVIAVGGFRHDSAQPAPYSSVSATGDLPRWYALCEWSEDLPGVRAAAVRSGEVMRMGGTSVAAPILARRLYNALCDGRRPAEGRWDLVITGLIEQEHAAGGREALKEAASGRSSR